MDYLAIEYPELLFIFFKVKIFLVILQVMYLSIRRLEKSKTLWDVGTCSVMVIGLDVSVFQIIQDTPSAMFNFGHTCSWLVQICR